MKKSLLAGLVVSLLAQPAIAAEWKQGNITVSNPFARATAGKATAGGSFLTIMNAGDADRLLAASTKVGAVNELHTHIKEGDVMKMRQVEYIDIPSHGMVELKPGGYHIMMMQLDKPLKEGEKFPLELTFEKAGTVTVEVSVGAIGAKAMPAMDHSKMEHKKPQ